MIFMPSALAQSESILSRQEDRGIVLPRVSATLSRFLTPVNPESTSSEDAKKDQEFQRYASEKTPSLENSSEPSSSEEIPSATSEPISEKSGVAQAFVQLFLIFQEHQKILMRRLGRKTYQALLKRQNGGISKGTVFDEKAE
jgi:hypothetical protein